MSKKKQRRFDLRRRKVEGDFWQLVLTLMISVFGLVMVLSASYYYDMNKYGKPFHSFTRDAIYLVMGWAAFVFLAFFFDYHYLKVFAYPVLIGGIVLLCLLFTPLGQTINNATRWLWLGPVTIMPGEIIKTCCILAMATYLSSNPKRVKDFKNGVLPIGLITVMIFLLIYKQPNLSTACTVVMIVFGMYYIAGLPNKWLLMLGAAGIVGIGALVYFKGAGYMMTRIKIAFDPWQDPLGDGYQVIQSLLALGSGGVLGVGIGNSVQKTLYLPEPQNDFILAIIGEELGYVGVILLILVYVFLVWRCFRAAMRARDLYGTLLASGVALHLGIQAVLNIAVVSASFFPTGIALPFITMGGNALMLFLAEMGIVYNISRNPCEEIMEVTNRSEQLADPAESAEAL